MYGGRLPIPAVKVEDMSTTNREDGKTTIVVLASEPSYSAFGNMVRKWLVCAICALAAVAMNAMWITANAYGDNSSDSSDSSSSSTDSGVTITENITDTENLLGSHAAEVTDAIAKTEKETGVHVHLLYLSSFNSQQKPGDWAATVMESMNPKPNTVMLAVASNDGNLVVVVSKNSDKWLLDNKTVDKLSEAAQQPLLENPPSWSGAATAMMDQIVKSKKASTSSSTVIVGIIIRGKPIEASIVVVDDEPSIRELLVASLHFAGFEVNTAASGSEAIEVIEKVQPDLIVLDVMLPDIDGFTVTRRIRQEGINAPVLFLTARDDTQDKIMGLTVGGDDYVTKPFSLEEVVARIRAILRRTREQVEDDPIIRVADLEINEDSHDVTRAGQPVDLSPTEYKLLRYLMDNEGRVLSKAQILDHVWQYDWGGDAAIVESYISYLRKKVDGIEVDDGEGGKRKVTPLIETKRGIGYMIREPKN